MVNNIVGTVVPIAETKQAFESEEWGADSWQETPDARRSFNASGDRESELISSDVFP